MTTYSHRYGLGKASLMSGRKLPITFLFFEWLEKLLRGAGRHADYNRKV